MSEDQYIYKRQMIRLGHSEWNTLRDALDGDGYKPPPGWRMVSFSIDAECEWLTIILEARALSSSGYRG